MNANQIRAGPAHRRINKFTMIQVKIRQVKMLVQRLLMKLRTLKSRRRTTHPNNTMI